MVKNELLLGLVVFLVSFCLSLAVTRDLKASGIAGLVAVPAAFAGLIAVNIKRRRYQQQILTALQLQIRNLEKWKHHLEQYLSAIVDEYNRMQEQVAYRHNQLLQLNGQISEKHKFKQKLTLDLIRLEEDKVKKADEITKLELQKEEVNLSVRSLKAEHQEAESNFTVLQAILAHLQAEISQQQAQKQDLEETLEFLRSQLHQWQTQEVDVEDITAPNEELMSAQPQKLLKGSDDTFGEGLDAEWAEFVAKLTYPELQVLRAIVEQDNPNATIKNIAESNITMPELLIDGINERAIATIGDIIIEPGTDCPAIADSEYLEHVKKLL